MVVRRSVCADSTDRRCVYANSGICRLGCDIWCLDMSRKARLPDAVRALWTKKKDGIQTARISLDGSIVEQRRIKGCQQECHTEHAIVCVRKRLLAGQDNCLVRSDIPLLYSLCKMCDYAVTVQDSIDTI